MGKYIDYKTQNNIYAPGIATYSVDGEKGDRGISGYSIYYVNSSLYENESETKNLKTKINNNILIGSVYGDGTNPLGYKEGDHIIDSDCNVYEIISDGEELTISESPIGSIVPYIKKNYEIDDSTMKIHCLSPIPEDYVFNVVGYNSSLGTYTVLYGLENESVISFPSSINIIKEVEVLNTKNGFCSSFIENKSITVS